MCSGRVCRGLTDLDYSFLYQNILSRHASVLTDIIALVSGDLIGQNTSTII